MLSIIIGLIYHLYNYEFSLLKPLLFTLPTELPSLLTKITNYELFELIGYKDDLYKNL